MTELAAFTILAILLAAQTVRSWWYRKIWQASLNVSAELVKELDKAVKENLELKIQLNGARAGSAFVKKYCDEWPEVVGE